MAPPPPDLALIPHLSLALTPGERADVSLVRGVITGLAEAFGLSDETLDDVLTATSEAVNNVVLHAYPEEAGPLWVDVHADPQELTVVVRDQGVGLVDEIATRRSTGVSASVGLAAMAAFSSRLELRPGPGQGIETVMFFQAACHHPPPLASVPGPGRPPAGPTDSRVTLTIRPAALAGSVLNRLVTALAARAGFTLDRLSDAALVAASLAATAADRLALPELLVAVGYDRRCLDLVVGPLEAGLGRALLGDGSLRVVERLADRVAVQAHQAGEMLLVVLFDRRPGLVTPPADPQGP